MKVALNKEMKEIDRITIEEYGIPGIVLMENAGLKVVDEILKDAHSESKYTVICGKGNNGGDGFVIARHLYNKNYDVKVLLIGSSKDIKGDALINFNIIKKLGVEVHEIIHINNLNKLKDGIQSNSIVIDALFGIGLRGDLENFEEKVIDIVNENSKYIISVDIPSGVNGDNGSICKTAIKADKTITFALPKCGNIIFPGAEYNGEVVLVDIGIPYKLIEKMDLRHNIITRELIEANLPRRRRNAHKGNFGKANIIAGSQGMTGAAILTCKSALRSGLGLLRLYIGESLNFIIKASVPEAITIPLHEMRKGVIGINHIEKILEGTSQADVLTIGPGCGNTAELGEIVKRVLEQVEIPIVLDADGLNVLSKNIDWLRSKKAELVITPHLGEMSRLTGLSIEEINKNPITVARNFAMEWQLITVLKGASTIVAAPNGQVFININGNPGMATAGSGDVLTGIITGLIAQGIKPLEASITGVYIHGLTGDRVAEGKGEYGLVAGDIVEELPYTIKEIMSKRREEKYESKDHNE